MKKANKGELEIEMKMEKMGKKFFDTYADAEIYMLNSGNSDQKVYKEGGRYFVFIEDSKEY